MALSHDARTVLDKGYTPLEGVMGDTVIEANCPWDEKFAEDYRNAMKKLAELKPDMIMLDDDFRMNV